MCTASTSSGAKRCVKYCIIQFHFHFQESLVRVPVHDDYWFFLGNLFCAIDARFSGNNEVRIGDFRQLRFSFCLDYWSD